MTDEVKKTEKPKLLLTEAIDKGIAVLKVDVDKLIKEALNEGRDALEVKMRQEIQDKMIAEKLHKETRTVEDFINGTGLTNVDFGRRLMNMSVQKEHAFVLRDDHRHLKDMQIWNYIRANYKEVKK